MDGRRNCPGRLYPQPGFAEYVLVYWHICAEDGGTEIMEQNLKTPTKCHMRVFVYAIYITKTEISHPYQSIFLWALSEEEECYNRLPFFPLCV